MRKDSGGVRKSTFFLGVLAASAGLFSLATVVSFFPSRPHSLATRRMEAQVGALGLTDLCLFTEARYTRNPSQADLGSAFQDHPFSLEHFPAGSFVEGKHP